MSNPCSCGGTEVFVVDHVTTPNTEYANTVNPLAIVSAWVSKEKTGFFEPSGERLSCELAAKVCARCGRVEWFAKDLKLLASFADRGIASVRRAVR